MSKSLGAQQHKGSGSGNKKHDMHTQDALIECKTVLLGKKSITLSGAYLEGLIKEAWQQDRSPVLSIEFNGRRWIMQLEDDYIELRDLKGETNE